MKELSFSKENTNIYLHEDIEHLDFETKVANKVTHLGIGAHQDDLEIMAMDGVHQCFKSNDLWFGGITCTDGSGSARDGKYASYSNEEMALVRQEEQVEAAKRGKYLFCCQLNYSSKEVKSKYSNFINKLAYLIKLSSPEVIYTHNPFDKHPTHVAVLMCVIEAIGLLDKKDRPGKLYGCEVWRGLDWLDDKDKVAFNLTGFENEIKSILDVYKSQIEGGKNYLEATLGRMRANATYFESHAVDTAKHLWFGIDLSPLIHSENKDLKKFFSTYINNFKDNLSLVLDQFI
jgi:LmbE family N-acetylglucosaminyl deacetylase